MPNGRRNRDWTAELGQLFKCWIDTHPEWTRVKSLGPDSCWGGSEIFLVKDSTGAHVRVWMEEFIEGAIEDIRVAIRADREIISGLRREVERLQENEKAYLANLEAERGKTKRAKAEIDRLEKVIDRLIK